DILAQVLSIRSIFVGMVEVTSRPPAAVARSGSVGYFVRLCRTFPRRPLRPASAETIGREIHPKNKEVREMSAQPFALPPLPWAEDALAPVISKQTIEFHYGKHHAAYVNNLNGLVSGTDMADMSLEQIARKVKDQPDKKAIFNNAGQVWNHTFFWNCLAPSRSEPSKALADKISESFGGMQQFEEQFVKAATGQFGSGWAWLTHDRGKPANEAAANADTPMAHGRACLLTVDVWEHAYYLDYQNRRPDFLKAVVGQRLNWKFASEQLEKAS